KSGLKKLFVSNEWTGSKFASLEEGKEAEDIVLDGYFWRKLEIVQKMIDPLIVALRFVDGEEKPTMGIIYDEMEKVKKKIAELKHKSTTSSPRLSKLKNPKVCVELFKEKVENHPQPSPVKQSLLNQKALARKRPFTLVDEPIDNPLEQQSERDHTVAKDVVPKEPHSFATYQKVMMTKEVRVIGKELKTELTTSIRNGMEAILQEIVHGKNKVVLERSNGEVKASDGVIRAPRTKSIRKKFSNTEKILSSPSRKRNSSVDLGDVENEARVNDVVMSQVETEARVNDLVAMAGDDNQGRVDDLARVNDVIMLGEHGSASIMDYDEEVHLGEVADASLHAV
ncbi:hypothetical protein IFM89_000763, partial [Coptis chinensis]